jgi:hypothetical protein
MDKELELKIKDLVSKIKTINEHEVRSLMILIRKRMELMPEEEMAHYLILNLFCNWVAHTEITKSITGLRTLARINNALVSIKDSKDMNEISLTISMAVGFSDLKTEFEKFIGNLGVITPISKNHWINFMSHILAIIKDVPLAFPPLNELKDKERKIYEGISNNAIKPGAGVVAMLISEIDYGLFHEKWSVLKCLKIRTADTTTFIVPLTIKL